MRARSLSRLPWRVYPPARAMATVSRAPVHSCTGHCKGSNSPRRIVSSPRVGRTTPGVCGGRVALTTPGAHSPRCAHLCTGRVALSRCGAVCNGSRLTRVVWNVPRCSPGVLQCLPRASLQRAGACAVPGVQGVARAHFHPCRSRRSHSLRWGSVAPGGGALSLTGVRLTAHPWGTLPDVCSLSRRYNGSRCSHFPRYAHGSPLPRCVVLTPARSCGNRSRLTLPACSRSPWRALS